jgi:hypothetical protein
MAGQLEQRSQMARLQANGSGFRAQPFEWKATADVILDKLRRCREAIVKS